MTLPAPTFVIVGAGLAGAKAAQTLRDEGFEGRVLLIGDEPQRPYERPPLSKGYLRSELPREQTCVHPESFYAEHGIELITGTAVTALDAGRSQVSVADGRSLAYDRLLVATGARPRRLSISGADLDGVHYLRTLGDSEALRDRLHPGAEVAVVGAGWIGAEFAATARQLGAEVTVIDPGSVPLGRVLGAELGSFYRDVHREHGVELLLGTGVEALEGDVSVRRVRTTDGRAISCDFVEHWANALNQGPAAARAMLGGAVVYDHIPYFFSNQYDVGMEYSGFATAWDEVVFRGDPAERQFVAIWVREGRVVAGMNVNVWDVTEHLQALIRSRSAVDVAVFSDVDTPLETLVAEEEPTNAG